MRGDFTLSYHYFRLSDARNHLELFLDIDGESLLETWRYFKKRKRPATAQGQRFSAAPAHRRIYLDFSGNVSQGRGKLRILRKGKFIDRRTRMSEVRNVHDAHLGANRRTRMSEVCDHIKVSL